LDFDPNTTPICKPVLIYLGVRLTGRGGGEFFDKFVQGAIFLTVFHE
jgi:hypothetical protein